MGQAQPVPLLWVCLKISFEMEMAIRVVAGVAKSALIGNAVGTAAGLKLDT